MNRRISGGLLCSLAGLLLYAEVAAAAVQARETICRLSIGSWQPCERDGEICMELPARSSGKYTTWHLNSPWVKDESGRFLACDPAGKTSALQLARESGPHCRWVFEVESKIEPKRYGRYTSIKQGPVGYTVKLQAAEGPFKGWYISVDEPKLDSEGKPTRMNVKLVDDVKKAAVFTYISERLFVK